MPHDFAMRLYRFTKLNTRVIIANAELKPTEFADPHLFVHKEKSPEIAAPVANEVEPVVAKPTELAVHANTLTPLVQSDVVTPQATAPAIKPDQKTESAAPGADAGAAGAAAPPAPATPTDLAKVVAAKKIPISIFVSRKEACPLCRRAPRSPRPRAAARDRGGAGERHAAAAKSSAGARPHRDSVRGERSNCANDRTRLLAHHFGSRSGR